VVTLTATLDEPPLTPIETTALLDSIPPGHERELHALAFLSYRQKLLAGSWRFLTYFGRDTLLTVRLLMPHARPELVEAGLGAVIDRLDPTGDVAHEEDIGDFAAWENHADGHVVDESPRFDYKMVDDDFLLAPVLAAYFESNGRDRAAAFLARRTPRGVAYRDAIEENLHFVLRAARGYAASPMADKLVHLHDRMPVGDWRDSNAGLADGRIPYDVNAALVPAALAAAAHLYHSRLFGADDQRAAEAERLAAAWHVADRFRVEIPADEARTRVAAYANSIGVPAGDAVASIDGPIVVRAISLDAEGRPIPVMNSDDGFVLLFGDPAPAFLDEAAGRLLRPFPAGLRTPIGIMVANPVFASEAVKHELTRADYHGTVVWSWQQALLAKGIDRQLARTDLPAATRTHLAAAQHALWGAIRGAPEMVTSELWSWEVTDGHWRVVPFGQGAADADESDAAQLWSTVYLAIPAP
jgi:glycogen debranching enzyme